MRFTIFNFLSGAMFTAGVLKTTPETAAFGWLYVGALVAAIIGAGLRGDRPRVDKHPTEPKLLFEVTQ